MMESPQEAPEGMSPVQPDDVEMDSSEVGGGNEDNGPPHKRAPARKRTKTGCLTCRKRRIKCDEGKPTCSNCIKSKRHCEGYTQRLTFKEPLNAYQHGAVFGHHPVFGTTGPEIVHVPLPPPQAQQPPQTKASSPTGPLPVIAPRPPPIDLTGQLPFQLSQLGQPYQGQPGPSISARQSPTAYSFQHQQLPQQQPQPLPQRPQQHQSQISQQSFLLSPDSTTPTSKTQFPPPPAAELYNVIPPTKTPEDPHRYEQISPVAERWQPESSGQRSLPTPVDDEMHPMSAALDDTMEYWHSDDEASMAASEDEEFPDDGYIAAQLESNDLGIQVTRRMPAQGDIYGTKIRSFAGFVNENVLETYMPSSTNSPLNDAQTAAIFWYFVNVTAPSISMYERHPFDTSTMFRGQPVPKTNQHLWTYTFPIIAFNHPALLQAILALGSLQMAKLHGVPSTASMKHYHLSLRRIAKNYQSTNRRTQPATLAATLLLGFYEVWNSDHDKWCKHMWGARAILREIPLRRMNRDILAFKRKRRERMQQLTPEQLAAEGLQHTSFGVSDMDVDTGFLSQLTGRTVSYDEAGAYRARTAQRQYTDRDLENFENLRDLYWWYCKMDVYQSVLGGAKLFMDYDLWTQCAPRAPFGRIDAIYGTFDHLLLLLGRMANFASSDLIRKRKARKPDPNAPKGPGGPGQSPPMFPGLVPASGNVAIPTGFSPPRDPSPPLSDTADDADMEASTAAALQEWEAIRHAFEVFRAHLGPDFEPLGPDLAVAEETPFGPSRTYRTYSIAGIWMNYYMGLVALHRAHPSMPPIAMMAAGLSARQTMPWAMEIGRISGGIQEDLEHATAVSTSVGAALIESSLCLFVCAVQFQTTPQRHWTVKRMHDIARLTGWQSARQIAQGCESGWTRAAQMGRGPPYHRSSDLEQRFPASVWANPRRIDRRINEVDGDKVLVLAKTEQAHYALGILGLEVDLDRLVLEDAR